MSETKFIMMCGLPASSKSTYAIELAETENAIILSSDQLRVELYGDINHQESNGELFEELYKRLRDNLKNNQSVILDATNVSAKKRMGLLKQLKDCKKEIYYFNTSFKACVNRDKERSRTVGKRVIDRMYRQLQIPIYAEGWDKIHLIHSLEKGNRTEDYEDIISTHYSYSAMFNFTVINLGIFTDIKELPHDSKWHSLSVSRHTYHVWEYILNNYDGKDRLIMLWAALLHDVGKFHTKEFKDGSRYANFLGHEFVSSQLACQFLRWVGYDDDFILKVVELVQLHMRLLGASESEKAITKLKEFVGEDVFNKLVILREADLQAH